MTEEYVPVYKRRVIYVFTINDEKHKNLVKIGQTSLATSTSFDRLYPNSPELNKAARERIKEYTNTAGYEYQLLHTELGEREIKDKNGKLMHELFSDKDVHRLLKKSGIDYTRMDGSTGREWFNISKDYAISAIGGVKSGKCSIVDEIKNNQDIYFRPEQEEAIKKTVKHFKVANDMLWNAKMRFGKTVCALEVIKRMGFGKTLIITHRPIVNDGWFADYKKIFSKDDGFVYGSKINGLSLDEMLIDGRKIIYFASVQDLRGSAQVGGKYNKNKLFFDTKWDCVVIDEAHEGTTTLLGEDTLNSIIKNGSGTKKLALSGTPFNIFENYGEDSIYTWDYVMEQESKKRWDIEKFGDSNPYADLPELRIYTYNLGELVGNNYISLNDKAFNFHEFFRTWTGDFKIDNAQMPETASPGDFVHQKDIESFLNLITHEDPKSNYPYSKKEYRDLFRHSLWMVPGVKEAKALKSLLLKNKIFGNGSFEIVNVAGNERDEDEESDNALDKVRSAIERAGDDGYTITLSCGKLTTGVTVKDWTAVFMLSGSYSTSAANYLQTIFRVQSPCTRNGKVKETCYVFDFAPDRTLKMVSSAVSISTRAGKTSNNDREILSNFLNYCPVISISGSEMKKYSTNKLLQELKKSYAERVVKRGFDDHSLYNDELLKLDDVDIKNFSKLEGIVGKSKATASNTDITINDQGLTNEEYERAEKLKQKKKTELSPEEKAFLDELKKKRKLRNDAISILRGISIRMPLLIFGSDVPYDDDISLEKFVNMIDETSWEEFMPHGVTKELFKKFQKYYDEEVFVAAGRNIRNITKEADSLPPFERVQRISELFSYFKNPDKETVLTPWRVVNMHLSGCIGGYDFYDDSHSKLLEYPRFVDVETVTEDLFNNVNSKFLEINSKTGLYPLYIAYSIFRKRINKLNYGVQNVEKEKDLWNKIIHENIFIISKTPMAKSITQRTLVGYSNVKINAHNFENLVNRVENESTKFVNKVLQKSTWKVPGDGNMKFDAIIGNPPYMEMDNGAQASSKPLYNFFVDSARKINPKYLSFIIPTRWFSGGKGLDEFRKSMIEDKHLAILHDQLCPEFIFPDTNIRGGVCYFLWARDYDNSKNLVRIVTHNREEVTSDVFRSMKYDKDPEIFIRYNEALGILDKVLSSNDIKSMSEIISSRKPFGIDAKFVHSEKFHDSNKGLKNPFICYDKGKRIGYVEYSDIPSHKEWANNWKVFIPRANNIGTELNDDNQNTFVGAPGEICSEPYMVIGVTCNLTKIMAENLASYMRTRFARFLHSLSKASQDATSKTYRFVPIVDFSREWTDEELYDKFNLSVKEREFIQSMIKPME